MRAVLVLSIIAVTSCRSAHLGYNYQPGSHAPGISSLGSSSSGSRGSGISIVPAGSGIQSVVSGRGFENAVRNIAAGRHQVVDGPLSTEFYTFSAPEEDFDDVENNQRVLTSISRRLRVIFIKTPENNAINKAVLQLARQVAEDRTAIYVLSKQPDVAALANQVQQISESVRHKPEVRFIKYRTNEDAVNAQRSIQEQYDALGGSSLSSDEGVAPVLNYASASVPHSVSYSGRNNVNIAPSVVSSNIVGDNALRYSNAANIVSNSAGNSVVNDAVTNTVNTAVSEAAAKLAQKGTDDETFIYLLSKEPDVAELASKIKKLSESARQKPDVRFVKYKTDQDAINIQKSIQQQYEDSDGLKRKIK